MFMKAVSVSITIIETLLSISAMVILEVFIEVKTSTVFLWLTPYKDEDKHCVLVVDTVQG
jgi:hypothetical protein